MIEGLLLDMWCLLLFVECYVLIGCVGYLKLKWCFMFVQFGMFEYVIVLFDGGGFFGVMDEVFVKVGVMWCVVLLVLYFLFVMLVVVSIDFVVMLFEWLVCDVLVLCVVDVLVEVFGYEMLMLWYECVYCDLVYWWLWEMIVVVVQIVCLIDVIVCIDC